jgi:hypothetical protein
MTTNSEIQIEEFINKINSLSIEKNKNIFIEDYNNIKKKIDLVDKILEKESEIDKNISIDKLFDILQEYDNIINKKDLDIIEFKKLKDIVELIENKLSDSKMNITEIK